MVGDSNREATVSPCNPRITAYAFRWGKDCFPAADRLCSGGKPSANPYPQIEPPMKQAICTAIRLTMTVLLLSAMAGAAEVPQLRVGGELQASRAMAAGSKDTRVRSAGIKPERPVVRFYQMVGTRPVWVDEDGLRPHGEALLAAIGKAFEDGLEPDAYLMPSFRAARNDAVAVSNRIHPENPGRCSQLDVALTEGMLRYAQHLSQGRVMPETLVQQWLAWPRSSTRDIPAELAEALNDNRLAAYIESLHPKGQAYQKLRKALQTYKAINQSGGWPTIVPGPTLRIGDRGARVDALIRRLKITADLFRDAPTARRGYDMSIEAAVKRFQRRHGLTPDGIVGKRTQAELNIPVQRRITQLQLNMERWRWLPDSLGDRYLMVNIPAYALHVVDAASRIDTMRVIVGTTRRQTPIISGNMTYLEFNPYWNIPRKIARRDILPKVIGDPAYLVRQGIRVFDSWDRQALEVDPASIPWEQLSTRNFPYRLRQDPSVANALGQVKFIFPNHHSVYIHDTPGKTLFNQQERDFSSGCIRVQTPLALAQHLLDEQGWDRDRIEATIARGQRKTVVLERPVPVHLVYFTTWVDADGTINFRKDIYGRDRDLLIALEQTRSNPYFCSNDGSGNPMLAAGNTLKTSPISTTDGSASARVPASFEPAGVMTGNPMSGI
jgi:L,D-transpeptidase YcbB